MSKRKKKNKKHAQHAKQKEAEQRSAFFKNIFRILKLYGCEDLYPLFDETERDFMFSNRFRYPKVLPAAGHNVSSKLLRDMKVVLFKQLSENKIEVKHKGTFISYMDHYTLNNSLLLFCRWLVKKQPPGWKKKTDVLEKCLDLKDMMNRVEEAGSYNIFTLALVFSQLEDHLYWIKTNYDLSSTDNTVPCFVLEVHAAKPEIISCLIDGKKRPLYRVGWGIETDDIYWSDLKPEILQMTCHCSNIPLAVYIQSHALRRLEERIDCLCPPFLQFQLVMSLRNPVFINFEGRMLIEYRVIDRKYGYLLIEYIEGFILIKTFLFLTNNGTPEGKKLHEISGLKKPDKQYWAIDKLSTFFTPDFVNNENLKALFAKAGCDKLFEPLDTNMELKETAGLADKIMQYIKLDEKPLAACQEAAD